MGEDFQLFSEKPCETIRKLRAKGVSNDSNYIKRLQVICDQKNAPAKRSAAASTKKNKILLIAGVGAAALLTLGLVIINSKKNDSKK